MSVGAYTTFVAAPPRLVQDRPVDHRLLDRAFAALVIGSIALVVTPDLITYLTVPHEPILPPGEATTSADLPLAQLASLGGSALLLMLTTAVVAMRGHPNRAISGLLVALLAVNLPYVISPELPPTADYPKILLANLFVIALWNVGAPISGLRWIPYTVAAISVYSLIIGVLMPDYAMYNVVSEKDIIPGWELAGPFGHANVLGMYCAVAFALTPLITERRVRWAVGGLLFLTMLAAASRTALLAAMLVVLWWLVCWVRSAAAVRLPGTVLVAVTAAATFVFPFVAWDPDAFTERAHVWAESLKVWHESALVGMGINWFLDDAQEYANIAKWAYVGTGHNMVVDTLVKSGLLGLAALVPLLIGAVLATRALTITTQQIACFGFLMAFFVAATTEAVWALLPNLQLFPISGMIFAVLILSRRDDPVEEGLP